MTGLYQGATPKTGCVSFRFPFQTTPKRGTCFSGLGACQGRCGFCETSNSVEVQRDTRRNVAILQAPLLFASRVVSRGHPKNMVSFWLPFQPPKRRLSRTIDPQVVAPKPGPSDEAAGEASVPRALLRCHPDTLPEATRGRSCRPAGGFLLFMVFSVLVGWDL